MSARCAFHLAVLQPTGYQHALAYLDHARYVRYQLRRLGLRVTLGKNRLRDDAVNLVFGAHLGFDPQWRARTACIFVNLEPLGGGAKVSAEYLHLLAHSAVVDCDLDNPAAYGADPADVPLLPFLHAPYLHHAQTTPLAQRPIDLLFFGSMNERRQAFLAKVEACGVQVSTFDQPIYGPERDHFIRQAKAVLNCHLTDASRFEQMRVAHCLSLGTPVISEPTPGTHPPAAFEDAVTWLHGDDWRSFFGQCFATPAFYADAATQIAAFAQHDPLPAYARLADFGATFDRTHRDARDAGPWRPRAMNLGSGADYRMGWLNVDVLERAEPDLVLDLGQTLQLPLERTSRLGGRVVLTAGSLATIRASNVLEHVRDLPALMTNALHLLAEGGLFEIEVPYEKALTAWQDPTHLRAMNENSWVYYTDWFWYLGWFEHRFEIASSAWLDARVQPCGKEHAAFMRVTLRKIATTPQERNRVRTVRADFGGIDDDPVRAAASAPLASAHAPVARIVE